MGAQVNRNHFLIYQFRVVNLTTLHNNDELRESRCFGCDLGCQPDEPSRM